MDPLTDILLQITSAQIPVLKIALQNFLDLALHMKLLGLTTNKALLDWHRRYSIPKMDQITKRYLLLQSFYLRMPCITLFSVCFTVSIQLCRVKLSLVQLMFQSMESTAKLTKIFNGRMFQMMLLPLLVQVNGLIESLARR